MGYQLSIRNLEEVHETNLSMVIKLLQKRGLCYRSELAKESGLKQSTITNIINELISCGLVEEVGSIEGKKGRRSIGIQLRYNAFKILALRLTRHSFTISKFNIGGDEEKSITSNINMDQSAEYTLNIITDHIRNLIDESDDKILAIGISVPGPLFIDKNEEHIVMLSGTSGWNNINIRKHFSHKISIPIYIEHDANAGALAEWWFGKYRMQTGVNIYVAAGQGIGAGIAINGNIIHGSHGMAGEIGHISINYAGPKCQCGNCGCLENYCSVLALQNKIKIGIASGQPTILSPDCSLSDIKNAILKGDSLAVTSFEEIAWFLGFGLSSLVNTYNPDMIIIGDELSCIGEPLLNIISKVIKEHTLPIAFEKLQIRLTSFHLDPALIGAAALAIEKLLNKPTLILKNLTDTLT